MKKLATLKLLQAQIDDIRSQLGISGPNEVVYFAPLNRLSEESVVVEADGLGGARLSIVEGNFPIDFVARVRKDFRSEKRAVAAAEKLVS